MEKRRHLCMAMGRAGLAVSVNTTDFPAVPYFCAAKEQGGGKVSPV